MEEVFICPFCGRDDIYRKCSFTLHVNRCKENPNRIIKIVSDETCRRLSESGKIAQNRPEVKQKISEASKRMWQDQDFRQKNIKARIGQTRSEETKLKMSEAQKGKKLSDETKQKIGKSCKISNNRPETKQKISEASKIMWENTETKQKICEALKGKTHSTETKQKISEASKLHWLNPDYANKLYNTKKQNNSFNTSKIEEQLTEYFTSHNINFKTQYKSDKYPFICDFYFPDKDLYVEIQGTWTHGKRPYIEDDLDCINQLELWKSKNKPFYLNAIDTWTIRDVRKRNYAKEHNLNWIEIFSDKIDVCLETITKLL